VDWNSEFSLHNWFDSLHLLCQARWKVAALGASIFLGWIMTMLWLPMLSDRYGRKKFFYAGICLQFVVFTVTLTTSSLEITIICNFLYGCLSSLRLQVGFLYLSDLVGETHRVTYSTYWCVAEGTVAFLSAFYYWQVSKDWYKLCFAGYVMLFASIVLVKRLPESATYLYQKGDYVGARKSLETIARFSGKSLPDDA